MNERCGLEHYALKDLFNDLFERYTANIVESNSLTPLLKTENIAGTSYAEFIDGEWRQVKLKQERTKFIIKDDDIRNIDLVAIRKEFYLKCLIKATKRNRIIMDLIKSVGKEFQISTDGSNALEVYLEILRYSKNKGGELTIAVNPWTYEIFIRELEKPENQERIKRELKEIENDKYRPKEQQLTKK
jgi:thiamine biosynthesis lipoprotein ApbE